MGRIEERFASLRQRGEKALVTFVTAGDPDLETTEALVLCMAEAGADIIELGVPFSDPIAEGPTIQRASERALLGGVTLRRVLELVGKLRDRVDVPLVPMGYANPIYAMGEQNFATACREMGVDGVIVPDLPPEEGAGLFEACRAAGVDPILLAAPTTTPERMRKLVEETRGFLYYVSLTGVTGARDGLAEGIEAGVQMARDCPASPPLCVGFGVSTPEQASEIARFADGVVVGSAIVDRVAKSESLPEAVDAVAQFTAELKAALRG